MVDDSEARDAVEHFINSDGSEDDLRRWLRQLPDMLFNDAYILGAERLDDELARLGLEIQASSSNRLSAEPRASTGRPSEQLTRLEMKRRLLEDERERRPKPTI